MSKPNTIVLSICTDAAEPHNVYQHGYHLGTDLNVARNVAADLFRTLFPKVGSKITSVALFIDDEMVDFYDGMWDSDRYAHEDLEGRSIAANDRLLDCLAGMKSVDLEYLARTLECEASRHPLIREALADMYKLADAAKARNLSFEQKRSSADLVLARWAA